MSLMKMIRADQVTARKNNNKPVAKTLTYFLGEVQRQPKKDESDEAVTALLKTVVKKLGKAVETEEIVNDIKTLSAYLPQLPDDEDVKQFFLTYRQNGGKILQTDMGNLIGNYRKYCDTNGIIFDGGQASRTIKPLISR